MTANATLLGEAELHGLVDGHLEADRRADVLRRLAASPADRSLVEAWQEQNDLIRAAFRDVEQEALPVALDLAPPRLRCIDGDLGRQLAPMCAPAPQPATRRSNALAAVAALLVVGGGLAASWLMINQGRDDEAASAAAPQAGMEATLADRAATALGGPAPTTTGSSAIRIPDLSATGLRLAGASTQSGEPLVLHYRDASGARVVLGIARAPDMAATPPATLGKALTWRHGGVAYALAAALPAERLHTLARSLQDDAAKD